jgi:hypothetical protein
MNVPDSLPVLVDPPQRSRRTRPRAALWLPLIYLGSVVTLFIAGCFAWGFGVIAFSLSLGVLFMALAVFPPLGWVLDILRTHNMDSLLFPCFLLVNSWLLYRVGRYLDS